MPSLVAACRSPAFSRRRPSIILPRSSIQCVRRRSSLVDCRSSMIGRLAVGWASGGLAAVSISNTPTPREPQPRAGRRRPLPTHRVPQTHTGALTARGAQSSSAFASPSKIALLGDLPTAWLQNSARPNHLGPTPKPHDGTPLDGDTVARYPPKHFASMLTAVTMAASSDAWRRTVHTAAYTTPRSVRTRLARCATPPTPRRPPPSTRETREMWGASAACGSKGRPRCCRPRSDGRQMQHPAPFCPSRQHTGPALQPHCGAQAPRLRRGRR